MSCIEAKGGTRDGYVVRSVNGKSTYSHRVALEKKLGRAIAHDKMALHSCHNRRCVNPDHLYEGTHDENMRDMVESGRSSRGSARPASKLTEAMVVDIRRRLSRGETGSSIAKALGVHKSQISRIKSGKGWQHVK